MEAKTKDLWVYVETKEDGSAKNVGLELLGPGRDLADKQGGKLVAIVIGSGVDQAVNDASAQGANQVIVVDAPEFKDYTTDAYTAALYHLIEKYGPTTLLIGATPDGRDLGPRLACRIKTGLTADCTALDIDEESGNVAWTRPAFGGNLMATILCPDHRPQIGTVRPGVFKKSPPAEPKAEIIREEFHVPPEQIRTELLEIIQERLEREYNLDLVTTAPGVVYKVHKTNGEVMDLTNPSNLPDPSEIDYMEEPMVKAEIMVTTDYIGPIMELCQERRGQYQGMEYMETTRALLHYHLPLNEIIYDFFDALKSRSRGYASFDYEMLGYERSDLVKLDILVNKEEVDALSFIVFAGSAYDRGRKMCEKLKEEIPRQLFEIPIQAAVGSKIIARETVKALRKDVLAKCYGGDISRKRKLLEKQKEGKKRMRQIGNVEIPQKAFMSVLKLDDK